MAKRILLVDDEPHIREVAVLALTTVGGFEAIEASSGREALVKALDEEPDAILLDVMMPDMDGPTTFLKLQEGDATQAIPVILLTAKIQSSDRERFRQLGVAGVISKPFDPMSLASDVAEILGW